MDRREYKARIKAYARMVGRKAEKEDYDVYKHKKMAVRMPLGCWIWLAIAGVVAVLGFKACFM